MELFKKYQLLLLSFANTHLGRDYLLIPRDAEKIVRLDANSYTEFLGRENDTLYLRQAFYSADNHFERYLGIGFDALETIQKYLSSFREAQEALAHYLGLRYAPQLPTLLFNQATFNALGNDTDILQTDVTYLTAHNAATGTVESAVNQTRNGGNGSVYVIRRFFCRWNTASLTSLANITAATIKIWVTATTNTDSTGLDIVQSTATDGVLVAGDYPNLGTTVYGTLTIAGLTISAYNTWTLNASGQANISLTANSKFAWRISQDTTATAPSSINADNSMTQQASGGANPEQLVVTYTLPVTAGGAFLNFI